MLLFFACSSYCPLENPVYSYWWKGENIYIYIVMLSGVCFIIIYSHILPVSCDTSLNWITYDIILWYADIFSHSYILLKENARHLKKMDFVTVHRTNLFPLLCLYMYFDYLFIYLFFLENWKKWNLWELFEMIRNLILFAIYWKSRIDFLFFDKRENNQIHRCQRFTVLSGFVMCGHHLHTGIVACWVWRGLVLLGIAWVEWGWKLVTLEVQVMLEVLSCAQPNGSRILKFCCW